MVFLHETTYKYSLEAPHQGASNKYTQHKSLLRDKNNIYLYTPRATKSYVSFKKFCDNDVISGSQNICSITKTFQYFYFRNKKKL